MDESKYINEGKRADQFLEDVGWQLNTTSQMDKFRLQQKLSDEWMSLNCDQRYAVGKSLESKAQTAEEHDVKARFVFNDLTNELSALEFRRYVSWDPLVGAYHQEMRIKNPMKGCDMKNVKPLDY